jgi:hypothetical protein
MKSMTYIGVYDVYDVYDDALQKIGTNSSSISIADDSPSIFVETIS